MLFFRISFSFLLLAISAQAQDYDKLPAQNSLKYYALNGAVNSVLEKKWIPSRDSFITGAVQNINVDNTYYLEGSEEILFDKNGTILKWKFIETEDRKKNKVKQRERVFFYRKNKLIGVRNIEDNRNTDSVEFHYRKKGQMDYYRLFNNRDDVVYKVTYVYKDDKVFTIRKKNEENFAVSMIKYKYKDNQLVETQHFDNQFRLVETRRYSLKRTTEGVLNDSYSITGDDGNIKEGLSLVKDSLGRILEKSVVNGNREVTEYNSYQYDSKGSPVLEKIFSSFQELTISNRYTYDAKGNWIRKEIFYNDKLNAVVLRDIQYEG